MTLQERLRERLDIVEGDLVLTQKVKDSAMDELAKARARLDALERENAALRADAERWRYARQMAQCISIDDAPWLDLGGFPWPNKMLPETADYADAAIDAAMAQR